MMNWNGVPVLITGAGGFIGSHLAQEMVRRGARVRCLVRYNSRNDWGNLELLPQAVKSQLEVVAGDVRDPAFMDGAVAGNDVVFHLAALITIPYSYAAPGSYVETNVTGTLNVLQAARRHGVRKMVHTSTSETYGTARYTPIDEEHPLQAQSPYAASKIAADKLAESFFRSFDLPVATLRPFNTFGPRQSARAVIPAIIAQALFRDRIELGSLAPVRDLTYVGDTVNGFLRIAEAPASSGEVVNLGTGQGIAIGDLAQKILSLLGLDCPIETAPERLRPERSEVMTLICDNAKARRMLNWTPQVSLEQGLESVIAWVRSHPAAFKPAIYTI